MLKGMIIILLLGIIGALNSYLRGNSMKILKKKRTQAAKFIIRIEKFSH